jgi:heat-inducible transcriptional repressor
MISCINLDQRTQHLLRTLIEHYIDDGQPVSSKRLTETSGLELSAATVRHIMADLEEMGLIASPHTSAGRIPTPQGYRLFVNNLLVVKPLDHSSYKHLKHQLQPIHSPQELMNTAARLLSELTLSAGIVQTPKAQNPSLQHIEFIRLSDHRVLLVLVTTEGDVQNRLLTLPSNYPHEKLIEASRLITERYAGYTLEAIREHLHAELCTLKEDVSLLLNSAIQTSWEQLHPKTDSFVVSGERRLLEFNDLGTNISDLKRLFNALEERTALLQLMHLSQQAQGVQIYIGGESEALPIDTCSLITASYTAHGKIMGTLGVIGPTRMAYERVIPIVDITARLLSSALNQTLSPPLSPSKSL